MRSVVGQRPVSLALLVRATKLFNEAANGLRTAVRPQLPLELAFVEATLPVEDGSGPSPLPQALRGEPAADRPIVQPGVVTHELTNAGAGSQGAEERASAVVDVSEANILPIDDVGQVAEEVAPFATDEATDAPETELPVMDEPITTEVAEPEMTRAIAEGTPSARLDLEWVKGNWRQVLMRIKPLSPQLQALLNSAEPIQVSGDVITLGCRFGFHRDKLSESKNRDLVEQVLSQVLGVPCRVTCAIHAGAPEMAEKSGPPQRRPGDLFSSSDAHGDERQELLNHPVVKELERRGGRVSKVSLNEEDQEDRRG